MSRALHDFFHLVLNLKGRKWRKESSRTQANYDVTILKCIFFFTFLFSPFFYSFLIMGRFSSKSFLFIYSYFYRKNTVQLFSWNNILKIIIIIIYTFNYLYHIFFFQSHGREIISIKLFGLLDFIHSCSRGWKTQWTKSRARQGNVL